MVGRRSPFLLGRQACFEGQTVKLQECNVVLPSIQAANIANQSFSRSYSHATIIAAFPGTSFSTSTAGAKWSSFEAKTRWNKNTATQLLTMLTQIGELENWKLAFILFEDHFNFWDTKDCWDFPTWNRCHWLDLILDTLLLWECYGLAGRIGTFEIMILLLGHLTGQKAAIPF